MLKRETETFSSICNACDVADVVGHEILMRRQGASSPLCGACIFFFKAWKKTKPGSARVIMSVESHGAERFSPSVFD